MNWKDEVLERLKKKMKPEDLAPVSVKNLAELKELLKNFRPEVDTMTNQLLKKGFSMIRKHQEFNLKSAVNKQAGYGGIVPATVPGVDHRSTWVDRLVESQLGGKRIGDKISWDLPEGRFEYDPIDFKLMKLDDN